MDKAQFAIMRFAKYKGPEIGRIEAHNERTKEKYASNLDIDTNRSRYNFHLVEPEGKYRAIAERQIADAGCRTRKDSVRVVETLVTASPEFFKGKKYAEVRSYFEEALRFIERYQPKETIISAVVHMDEKTPHMHLSFVPLTKDGRLSAKEIVGNKKKLTWWQDQFWKHMVRKYPDLERGESAGVTGRDHIPPRVFKEAVHLNREFNAIAQTMAQITPFNSKAKSAEAAKQLQKLKPRCEDFLTLCRRYSNAIRDLKVDKSRLAREAEANKRVSMRDQLETAGKLAAYENLLRNVERFAPELLERTEISSRDLEM